MHRTLFDAPKIDSATIDFYLARGRRERARVFAEMVRSIFSSPTNRTERTKRSERNGRTAELHSLPVRERTTPAADRSGEDARAA